VPSRVGQAVDDQVRNSAVILGKRLTRDLDRESASRPHAGIVGDEPVCSTTDYVCLSRDTHVGFAVEPFHVAPSKAA
jgi:hypothetical protein